MFKDQFKARFWQLFQRFEIKSCFYIGNFNFSLWQRRLILVKYCFIKTVSVGSSETVLDKIIWMKKIILTIMGDFASF